MIKKSAFLIAVVLLLAASRSLAQDVAPQDLGKFQIMEDSMLVTADSMYEAFIPDTRTGYSERFARQLVRALRIPNSWAYPFDKLREKINIIKSDDSAFRIFNWEITPSAITKRYYGAIQLPGDRLQLIGLNDYSEQLGKGAEDSVLSAGKWFGAIYYRIMPVEVNGQIVYTLFGFNGSATLSNRKVLDAMILDNGHVRFGAPIFGIASSNFARRRINRFILEYKKDVQVSMNWNDEKKMIVFDHLASQMNDPHRKYTYAPTGQYDGLKWANESWQYVKDLIPVTILQDGEAPTDQTKE